MSVAPPVAFSPKSLLVPYQRRFIDDPGLFKVGIFSRQTGKSFTTAGEAVEDCLRDPGTKWVCMSAGERQALEWLEKAADWAKAYKLAIETQTEDRDTAEALLKRADIEFANGSRIIGIPANPNTARGYSANVILDEFAYHEDPDAIWAAMFPSVSNKMAGTFMARVQAALKGEDVSGIVRHLKLRVVSTYNGQNNKFFEIAEKAPGNGFTKHLVTIYDAVKDGMMLDINQLREANGDPDIWAQEFECVPMDASSVLLPYDLIATCESNEATTTVHPDFWQRKSGRALFMGIDFARKRNLSVAWTDEQVGDVLQAREVLEMAKMSTPDQIDLLRHRIKAVRRVCLDYTGPGVGMGDFLVKEFGEWNPERHLFGKIELCTFSAPFKVDIFTKLRMAFENRRERIPVSRSIREDFHSMQRVVSQNGNITYRAPHTDDGHADRITAKALCRRAAGDGPAQPVSVGRVTSPKTSRARRLKGL